MIKNSLLLLVLTLVLATPSLGQVPLSLSQVADSVLLNNYNLRLIRIDANIAREQNTLGAAGYYPSLSLNGTQQNSSMNTRQEFFNGDVREATGALNQSLFFGVRLDWNLFQGFYVQSLRTELQLKEEAAELQAILTMEAELYESARLYYEILAREQLFASLDTALRFSQLRVTLEKKKLELGKTNRLDYLQSLLDLNADSARWLQESTVLVNLKTKLKQQMGATAALAYSASDTMKLSPLLTYEDLRVSGLKQNTQLRNNKLAEIMAVNGIRMAQSQRYPSLGLFSEYSFVSSQSAVGILKSNQSLGPSVGLGLSYNLFNGSQVNRDIAIAKLRRDGAMLQNEGGVYTFEMEMLQIYEDYLLQRRLVEFEARNVELARENVKLAQIQLNAGSINAFQFRDVQQVSVATEGRYANALYNLKRTELDLMRISGDLIQYIMN